MNPILLVARRELLTRVRTKSFIVSNALILVVLIAGLVILSIVSKNNDSDATKVGLVGATTSVEQTLEAIGKATGTSIDAQVIESAGAAREQVQDGDLEAALLEGGQVLVKESLSTELHAVLQAAVQQQATNAELLRQGVDVDRLSTVVNDTALVVTPTDPKSDDRSQRLALAYIGTLLLFMAVATFAPYVGVGVVEEKSSRVVELLLSTIKPLHLLWGKVLGLGVVGLVQVAVFAAVGLVTGQLTGQLDVPAAAVWTALALLVWFVLGFTFYAVLYAAGGSMVSRQEEIQSTTMPVLLVLIASLYLGLFGVENLDSTFYTVMSFVPPFSAVLMPMQIAVGNASFLEVAASVVVMAAATAACAWLAAGIYQRSVLRTGAKVSWKEAIGR
jgi:ABC-2 type transport system permease protein